VGILGPDVGTAHIPPDVCAQPPTRRSSSQALSSPKDALVPAPASPLTVGHLSNDDWAAMLRRSVASPIIDGVRFPLFPAESTQLGFVGSSGEASLHEPFHLWLLARNVAAEFGNPLHRSSKLLDFGVGWGRIPRPFLHDVDPENIMGVDPISVMVDLCRDLYEGLGPTFVTTPPLPRTTLPSESFDMITAYSVFSHLSEQASTSWMVEFLRLLRPGGFVVATTHGLSLLDMVEQVQNDPSLRANEWHEILANGFSDLDIRRREFADGRFVHSPHGGGEVLSASFYGDSLFGEKYIVDAWSHLFTLCAYEEPPWGRLPQTVFVLQKPLRSSGGPIRHASTDSFSARQFQSEEVARLTRELEAIKSSETWKLGRALTFPLRRLRRER
jgi:SAM-dependent methyltransferase